MLPTDLSEDPKNLTKTQCGRLKDLLRLNLRTVRAYLLKEDFAHLWEYGSAAWASGRPLGKRIISLRIPKFA